MAPKAKAKAAAEDEKKRKAEDDAEKDAKKAKKSDDVEMEDDKEAEKDDVGDSRPALKTAVSFDPTEATLNVVPTTGGRILMALSEGGMQYFIAGCRANVGMKAGRYLYECKVVEALNPGNPMQNKGRVPSPLQLVRIGFSTEGSSLILGDGTDSVFFDSEGCFNHGKSKTQCAQRFTRDQVMGLLLNLDPKSKNYNTVSLFREGERVSEPQKLPESLHGKVLFPHVSYRNVTLQLNFGPQPLKELPFKVRCIGAAAQADAKVMPSSTPKDGKYNVLLPVAFPDEGTFCWLDEFLKKNKSYVELSDRSIMDWALKSGMTRGSIQPQKNSNDKPEFNLGVPAIDDHSVRRVMQSIAQVVPRNYVVMEVKSNLVAEERKQLLQAFDHPQFKKTAQVVMGEPPQAWKEMNWEKMLEKKQTEAENAWKLRNLEKERKKQLAIRQKQLADLRKKNEEEQKKRVAEAKKKLEEVAKAKAEEAKKKKEEEKKKKREEAEAKGETIEEDDEEEKKKEEEEAAKAKEEEEKKAKEEEEKKAKEEEEAKKKEEEEKKAEEEEEDEPMPQVELTEEDKKSFFPISQVKDLTDAELSKSFANFSIPEKSEGFHEIKFEWQNETKSKDYLSKWVLERKLTTRIEDLKPSEWFTGKYGEWTKLLGEWQKKVKEFTEAKAKKPAKKAEEAAEGEEGEEKEEAAAVDIYSVEDMCDVGNGEPLFSNFTFDDWTLLSLRFELYLLVQAFKKDVSDPDRIGITEQHLAFYYTKYYNKQISPLMYGVKTNQELVDLVKDSSLLVPPNQVLATTLSDIDEMANFDIFVKLTEENRRERQRRIDAGDETARLKFDALKQHQQQKAAGAGGIRPGMPGVLGKGARPAWPGAAAGKGAWPFK
eukprot:gnl/TRDRNA2_/TRDRNA2_159982_c1_seq1.p1 gnl/TRDRNA2_/TRDRNA2_159982_c1~~gnl/TRDRNA2_/TRDRNA2_159982_c1_seq1.p1  ORF type:complete len:879 (+),score=344.53 gnl/TRDRNA2_/TRDRNA2_159982_c1_seq1:71-2707(+)